MQTIRLDQRSGPRTRMPQWLALTACALLLAACGNNAVTETAKSEPTMAATQAASEEVVAVEPQPTPQEPQADHCTDCHSEKQKLIDTAAPEEPVEAESEGEG